MTRPRLLVGLFAFLVGLVFSLHNLIPWFDARQKGMSFTPFNGGDENIYAAQAVDAANGNLFAGDNLRSLPFLGPLLLGGAIKIFGSAETVFILADFFLPALIFILLYSLSRKFGAKVEISIIASLGSLFLYQLTTKINPLDWFQPMFFNFNRLIPPQLTFIFFVLFLLALYRRSIWSGFWAGLLAYIYFYHWSAAILILGIYWLMTKDKKLLAGLMLAGVISAGYLLTAIRGTLEQQVRFGRLDGRFIEPLTTFRYLLIIGLVAVSRLSPPVKKFFIAIFLAAAALMNLQLITGYTVAPGHWPSSTFEPLVPLALVLIAAGWLRKFWWAAAGLILIYAAANQVMIASAWKAMYQLTPAEKELLAFFKDQERPVVLSLDKRLNFYLPVLVDARLYLPYGSYSSLDNEALWGRFNCAMVFSRLDGEEIDRTLTDTQILGHLFDLTYNEGLTVFSFGRRRLPENIKEWSRRQISQGPECSLVPDYIILRDNRLDGDKAWRLEFNNQDFFVYQQI